MNRTNNTTAAAAAEYESDETLVAFATTPGANAREWMRQHPALAGDLARLAADHALLPSGEAVVDSLPGSVSVERLRQIGRDTVRACRLVATPTKPALTSLVAEVKVRGLDARTLAAQLAVPHALFFKLHRRLISPDSIPATLVRSLSEALDRTVEEVSAYLRQPPTLAVGASYRADGTPQAGAQETFADALQADPELTDAQRARWLNGGDTAA